MRARTAVAAAVWSCGVSESALLVHAAKCKADLSVGNGNIFAIDSKPFSRREMGNECALARGCGRCRLPMEIRCAHRREYKAVLALVDEPRENKFSPLIANGFSFSNAARTVDAVGIGILSADFLFAFGLAVDCRSNRTLRHTRCHGSFKIRDGGVGLPGNTVAQQQCASVRSIFGETRTIAGSRGLTFTCPRLKHPKLSDYPSLRRGAAAK